MLAKAGVQVTVKASNDLDGEAYKRLQNDKMLNLYLDRRPGKKILLKQCPEPYPPPTTYRPDNKKANPLRLAFLLADQRPAGILCGAGDGNIIVFPTR